MATELTKKEKGFIKDYLETGNGTEAALKNYDTEDKNIAASIASQNLTKLKIQNEIRSIADSLPDEDLIKVHKEGLQATADDMPDYSVRHKYLDSAYKLKGAYAPDKSINLNIEADITNPKARELADRYESELKQTL